MAQTYVENPYPNSLYTYPSGPLKRKRGPRASVACESCRRLKTKCDQRTPCYVCISNSLECIYRSTATTNSKSEDDYGNAIRHGRGRSQSDKMLNNKPRNRDPTGASRTFVNTGQSLRPGYAPTMKVSQGPQRHDNRISSSQHWGNLPVPPAPSLGIHAPENGSMASLALFDVERMGPTRRPTDSVPEATADQDPRPAGFGEINYRTNGKEFYGPAATLAFLLELRSRARAFQSQHQLSRFGPVDSRIGGGPHQSSIVNFLDADDDVPSDTVPRRLEDIAQDSRPENAQPLVTTPSTTISEIFEPNHDLEKECIDLYFANLHLIYYFLNKSSFLDRCEREIWSKGVDDTPQSRSSRSSSKFPALYNAVVAVGVLTAGDDALISQSQKKIQGYMDHRSRTETSSSRSKQRYLPLELGKTYFARAKTLLGDIFESCCLESQQTLFLMSVFCQYALKPHNCYMYSGMSARTALAIGSANEPNLTKNPLEAVRTWWCAYYHEMEVCCSLGRETLLREPEYYPVYMAKFGEPMPAEFGSDKDENIFWARAMTELATILRRTLDKIYHTASSKPQESDKPRIALELDARLVEWRKDLAPIYDLENTSLTEKESATKRKVLLKLRFCSARILIHRPLLVAAAHMQNSDALSSNVDLCLQASKETIQLLYDTFVNRPFFRTWWYNTTYAFNAITITLYALVSRLQSGSREALMSDVEKTLKIFQAMDGIAVARRCAELTQEIYDVAKISVDDWNHRRNHGVDTPEGRMQPRGDNGASHGVSSITRSSNHPTGPRTESARTTEIFELNIPEEMMGMDEFYQQDDFFADILDGKVLDNFNAYLPELDIDRLPSESMDSMWNLGV